MAGGLPSGKHDQSIFGFSTTIARGLLSCRDRLRFLRLYLGRPFRPADRRLVRQIMLKSWWIAAHTEKNNL